MSLKVVYRNWNAEGVPHVHEFEGDSFSFNNDRSLLVRKGGDVVACIAAGEWMAVWRPESLMAYAAGPPAPAAPAEAAAAPAADGAPAPS